MWQCDIIPPKLNPPTNLLTRSIWTKSAQPELNPHKLSKIGQPWATVNPHILRKIGQPWAKSAHIELNPPTLNYFTHPVLNPPTLSSDWHSMNCTLYRIIPKVKTVRIKQITLDSGLYFWPHTTLEILYMYWAVHTTHSVQCTNCAYSDILHLNNKKMLYRNCSAIYRRTYDHVVWNSFRKVQQELSYSLSLTLRVHRKGSHVSLNKNSTGVPREPKQEQYRGPTWD